MTTFAEFSVANDPDVELLGRTAAPRAKLGEDEATTVLVGAGSMASTMEVGDGGIAGTRGGSQFPARDPAPEAMPVWSFRDRGGRAPSAPQPPAETDRNQVELPFSAAADVAAAPVPTSRPEPLFGPVGRGRSPVMVATLSALTLGIYALVWHQRVNREMEEFDPKLHSRPVRSAMAITVPWLIGLAITLAGGVFIVAARLSIQVPLASHVSTTQADALLGGLLAIPYLVLILPFSLVAVVMTLERLRCVEEHVGVTTDRQVRAVGTSLLLLVPVVGGLTLLGITQRRLNAIWDAVSPAGRLSL